MKIHLTKWGNRLAVRIPGPYARQAQLKAGDAVEMQVTPTGDLHLHPVAADPFDKAAFLNRLKTFRSALPESEPMVETMRRSDRYS